MRVWVALKYLREFGVRGMRSTSKRGSVALIRSTKVLLIIYIEYGTFMYAVLSSKDIINHNKTIYSFVQ